MSPLAFVMRLAIHAYRLTLSPFVGRNCRFLPTCSQYGLEAIARHGAIRGGWLTLRRIGRCHPWGGSGYDPVPDSQTAPIRDRPHPRPAQSRTGSVPPI